MPIEISIGIFVYSFGNELVTSTGGVAEGLRRKGDPPEWLVHPRTRVGGGARWLAVREADEPDSGRGRRERSDRSPPGGSPFLRRPWGWVEASRPNCEGLVVAFFLPKKTAVKAVFFLL